MPVFELNRLQGIILRIISIFGQKMYFELDSTPKWKLFFKFGLLDMFLYQQKFQKNHIWELKSFIFRAKSLARQISRKISNFGKKKKLNYILRKNENLFHNLGSMICFSTTRRFRKVLFENSKSVCFWAKLLARHHFDQNIHFWLKN